VARVFYFFFEGWKKNFEIQFLVGEKHTLFAALV
jgi:hypothetical protein